MATFIKPGYWIIGTVKKKHWLNLDLVISTIVDPLIDIAIDDNDTIAALQYPVENSYIDNTALFADQGNQTINFFQYVIDTDIYYEYLGTTVGDITDYRELTADETTTIILAGKSKKPVNKIYANAAAMYSDQNTQVLGFLYRTSDDDAHFEYLGTRNGDDTDYKIVGIDAATLSLQAVTDVGNTTTLNIGALSFNDLKLFSQIGVDVDNIGIGIDALQNNTGVDSIGIGTNALQNNTGFNITAIGYQSLQENTGNSSTAVGIRSGQNNTGFNTTAIGNEALRFNTGFQSQGIGTSALELNKGIESSAVGSLTARYNAGDAISAFGNRALEFNSGDNSTAIGIDALRYNEGTDNTALGANSALVYIEDTGNAEDVADASTDVDFANNQITITAHGFGATNDYINLRYTTTGTPIGGLPANTIDQWLIIDANTIECISDNLTSNGTDTHTFTPQITYSNFTVLGASAEPTKSNQVVLGDSSVTEVYTDGHIKTHQEVKDDTTTTYNFILEDRNSIITLDNASAVSAIIPANSSIPYPIGTSIVLFNKGAGTVTVSITTDTLNQNVGGLTMAQYDRRTITKLTTTSWILSN